MMESDEKAAVLGLDLSTTASGLVVLGWQGDGVPPFRWSAREVKPLAEATDALDAAVSQVQELDGVLGDFAIKLAVIEGYGFASQRLAPLVEVGTCYRLKLRQRGVPYVIVAPSQLKKWATGSGGSKVKKDQVRLGVYKRWGFEHDSNNVVDAYALATIGLALRGAPVAATDPMRQVLAKLQEA